MASIGIIKTPVKPGVGGCLDCNWYKQSGVGVPCPSLLQIYFPYDGDTAITFLGSPLVGEFCPDFSASYCTADSGTGFFYVDVWAAYRDGAWTSSVTIALYYNVELGSEGGTEVISAAKNGEYDQVNLVVSRLAGSADGCPEVLVGYVTVTDKGVLTIA